MTAIAGMNAPNSSNQVYRMLNEMSHRGSAGQLTNETEKSTLGLAWTKYQTGVDKEFSENDLARDFTNDNQFTLAYFTPNGFFIKRDPFGISPLYYGWDKDNHFIFASEMKGLLPFTRQIHEFPPGAIYNDSEMVPYFNLVNKPAIDKTPEIIALTLKSFLQKSVKKQITGDEIGVWLSGGLDSSIMAALARPLVGHLHTFSVGMVNSPDLQAARSLSMVLDSIHHERIVQPEDLKNGLYQVIFHLESFDPFLVRSSLLNFILGKMSSEYQPDILTGEGSDELFAGYPYLKSYQTDDLADELITIIRQLHNTALQRVDRCSSSFEIRAHVGFLDMDLVNFAIQIPVDYKIYQGTEKWILRQAMKGLLPDEVLNRKKAKFWEGGGVNDIILNFAEQFVSDHDFNQQKVRQSGLKINSKEEMLYYRIFCDHFGEFDDYSWMGRTKIHEI